MGESVPLQAIILADSITSLFEPITLECPKDPSPLMIDHKLAWLESANVEQVFVLCSSSHSKQILNYLDKSKWVNKPNFSVTIIESNNCITAGDALHNMIKSDFILVSGDTVTNMMLTQALKEHKENNAVMTMVIKQSKPCQVRTDELIMAIDPTTKQLLDYEDKTDYLRFDNSFLIVNPCYSLHNDKQDCYIDICSPQVLRLFTDINVDYQHLRRDFVKGLLADDKLTGFKIFTHEIHSSYYAEFLIKNNNNPNPTELESDTESSYMMEESKDEKFEKKVERIFLWAVHDNAKVADIVSELQPVRVYYKMGFGKCAGVLLKLMMKLALDNSNNSGIDLVKETHYVISKWGGLLKPFSRGVDKKIQVISKLEKICLESMNEYAHLFVQVLYVLYVKNVVEEESILKWANEKDNVFVKQSEKFIQWLKEASEEKYQEFQETDLKRLKEGGVQVKKTRRMSTDLKRLNEGGVRCLSIC